MSVGDTSGSIAMDRQVSWGDTWRIAADPAWDFFQELRLRSKVADSAVLHGRFSSPVEHRSPPTDTYPARVKID